MWFGFLVLLTALSISAVAIYYSVAGLVAIFAAAALPIMIMGGTLEVAKLVTAVWLHKYWSRAVWWLKYYLATAVVVLMLITSMGIFGFLSKAHIEQTSASQESVAQVQRLATEIGRQQGIVARAEEKIRQLESSGTGADANIQSQIDKEQERIDNAYVRIQPAIDEQNRIIENVTALFQAELTRIDEELATLQGYIDAGEIRKAQGMVGTATDGAYGPKTAAAFTAWQDAKRAERNEWLQKIQQSAQSPTVKAARDEIARLRASAESQVAQSQALIQRLRGQLAQTDKAEEIDAQVDEQNLRIKNANAEIDTLTEQKYALEAEYRKLEAEVGPIKYIAEFVYGDNADTNMLEEAVRWVIITIIFVFDPLAVLLLIASQYTIEMHRKRKDDGESLRLEREEYERARAQKIIDNPGFTIDTPKEETKEEVTEPAADPIEEGKESKEIDGRMDIREPSAGDVGTGDNGGDTTDGMVVARTDDGVDPASDPASDPVEKKDIESLEESEETEEELEERIKAYEEKEKQVEFNNAKAAWKLQHPDQTVKFYKTLYIKGKIDKLPWEQEDEGYVQNGEQNESTLFNRLQK